MTIILGDIVGTDLMLGLWPRQLRLDDRLLNLHKHVIGVPGMGKSKLLESMVVQLLEQGYPMTFIDPDGSSADAVLKTLIDRGYFNRPQKLHYLEFGHPDWHYPYNPLKSPGTKAEIAALVLEAFQRAYFWADMVSAVTNFNRLVDATVNLILDNDLALTAMEQVITNPAFRQTLYAKISDPQTQGFFQWYDGIDNFHRVQFSNSVLSRAYDMSASPVLRNAFIQPKNGLDIRKVMDNGESVIVNLGRVNDEKTQRLLGSFLMHGYEVAAFSRPPNSGLPNHQLIVDEFSLFASQSSESFARMLDRTRKYGLFLTLCHQSWAQSPIRLSGALQAAMVKVSFRVGHEDAVIQAKAFSDIDIERLKSGNRNVTVQEQYSEVEQRLATLAPRRVLAKLNARAPVELLTPMVAEPRATQNQLDILKEWYFKRSYTPTAQMPQYQMPTAAPKGSRLKP